MRVSTTEKIKDMAASFISLVVRLAIVALAVFLIYKAGVKAYDFGYRIFTEPAMSTAPGRDVAITITQGDSLKTVADMFEEKGLIRDSLLFYIQKKVSLYDGDIKPGFYTLNTSMTAEEMFAVIAGDEEESESETEAPSEAEPLTETTMEADPLMETPLEDLDITAE